MQGAFATKIRNMKYSLCIAFLLFTVFGQSQITKKVLFIGNSYTSSNNLPSLISSMATADGNTLTTDAHMPGGAQLNAHAVNPIVLNKIVAEDWDFVVLQEQSQKPSFPDVQVQNDVYPYAEILVDSIYSNNECSVPLFYNTWGKESGESQWIGINTFEKMNQRLFNAYTFMADQADGMMSPVGIGFAHIKQDVAAVVNFTALYNPDQSHPSIYGSYLAACIFNNLIFENTSTGNTYLPSGVTSNEAEYLQGVADHVVYEVDSIRVDFRPLSDNSFSVVENESEIAFTPIINFGDFEFWDFGDGETSTQEFVSHAYTNIGTYEITMSSSNNCYTGFAKKQVVIGTSSLIEESKERYIIFPNPSLDGLVHIELSNHESYTVYSALGELVFVGTKKQLLLDRGVYIFRTKNKSQKIIVM